MRDMPVWNVLVTAEYESTSSDPFIAALHITEAVGSGSKPWPVALKIEVSRDA